MTVVAPPQVTPPADTVPPAASKAQLVSASLLVALPLIAVVVAIVIFWSHGIGWLDLGLGIGMYLVTGIGLSVGFHRLFSHRSFVPARWLKVTLAIAGTMGVEGSLTSWVSQHRRHHAFTDRPGDPHSPAPAGPGLADQLGGLWHAHAGWLFVHNEVNAERWSSDLQADPDLAFVSRTVVLWTVLSFLIPTLIGWVVIGTIWGALLAGLWGGVVRVALLHHVTWSTNSLCHTFGKQPFGDKDRSTNFAPLALLSFGDSWHNTHHAFPRSARHGVDPGEVDIAADMIRVFERMGWATDVHWPRHAVMNRRRALFASDQPRTKGL